MTAGAPWSVKGIDPKAREVAKHHARRSGMTLGEWLNRIILEDEGGETGEAYAAPALRSLAGEDELGRVSHALDRLTDRLEAAETRTGLAISGVEHSVRQALARIEAQERESLAVAARVDGAVERVGGEQSRLAERLRQFEAEAVGPRSTEALRAIEQSVGRMAGQMYEAEARMDQMVQRLGERLNHAESHTAEAIEALRSTLSALDGRLATLEAGAGDPRRFEMLAETLEKQVEAVRLEVSARLASVDGGRVDRRFAEIAQQVKAAEQRSQRAVQQMGRDVLSMAEAVNRRLQASEDRHAEAIARAGEDMSRVAAALEARLGAAERSQAEALERLSGELGKITDRLSERLLVSERRAAEAIDDVGEQVARVTERIAQSQDRAVQELAGQIRESEERTAKLLEETRARLERRLGESPAGVQRLADLPEAPDPEPPTADQIAGAATSEISEAAEAESDCGVAEPPPAPAAAAFGPELFSRAEDFEDEGDELELTETPRTFSPPRSEPSSEFAPIPEPEGDLFDLDQPEPPAEATTTASLSTREVIEQARAAARAANPEQAIDKLRVEARSSWRATRPGRLGAMLLGAWPKRPPNSTLQTAILVAGGAAFLSVGAAGVVLMQGPPGNPPEEAAESTPAARAAVALAPPALDAGEDSGPRPPAQLIDALHNAFAKAAAGVKAGEAGALAKVRALAEAGHPPAQFFLGKLYESGQYGVKQNWSEARRWTQRAAEGGDPGAMHNLALYDFRGEGGEQDLAAAARWFRAAADLGVVDSQYNLGLLYESGNGVKRDLAQAFTWFAIAASRGDVQAKVNAERIEAKLTPAQRAAADQAIGAFAARTSGARSSLAATASSSAPKVVSVVSAQRILGRLGYYKGQANGQISEELRAAVTAYQRDQRLAATGQIDEVTAQRLAAFTR